MKFFIRKIDRSFLSSTLLLEIIVSVVAGLSSYFWGVFSTSDDMIYAHKSYLKAEVNQVAFEKTTPADATIDHPVTIVLLNEYDRGNSNVTDRATLAEILNSLHSYGPRAVGLDFYFEESDGPNKVEQLSPKDLQFLEAIEQNRKKTVLGMRLVETSSGLVQADTPYFARILQSRPRFGVLNAAYDMTRQSDFWYKTRLTFDQDPHTAAAQTHDKKPIYCSLPMAVYLTSLKKDLPPEQDHAPGLCKDGALLKKYLQTAGQEEILKALNREIHIDYNKTFIRYNFHVLTWNEIKEVVNSRYRQSIYLPKAKLSEADRASLKKLALQKVLRIKQERYYIHPEIKNIETLQEKTSHLKENLRNEITGHWNMFLKSWPGNLIHNKMVLVGSEYADSDLHKTPLTPHTALRERGVFIHARILNMLHNREFIYAAGNWANILIVFFNLLLVFSYTWFLKHLRTIYLFFLAHFAGFILLNYSLFIFLNVQYGMTMFSMGAIITIILTLFARTSYTGRVQTPGEKAIISAATTGFQKELIHRITPKQANDLMQLERYNNITMMQVQIDLQITSGKKNTGADAKIFTREVEKEIGEILTNEECLLLEGSNDSLLCLWNFPEKIKDHTREILAAAEKTGALSQSLPEKWLGALEIKTRLSIKILLHHDDLIATVHEENQKPKLFITGNSIEKIEASSLPGDQPGNNIYLSVEALTEFTDSKTIDPADVVEIKTNAPETLWRFTRSDKKPPGKPTP